MHAQHVPAAAAMTRELSRDSGDHVIVLHVHEFSVGRYGRIRVDCGDGEGERTVEAIVADLKTHDVSAEAEIRETHVGHIAATILAAAHDHDARIVVLGSRQPHRSAPDTTGQRGYPAAAYGHASGPYRAPVRTEHGGIRASARLGRRPAAT